MGCCQSLPEVVEPVVQRRKGSPPLAESSFPEKLGPGGYKVLVTSSSSELDASSSGTARGRAYARTVVGPTWVFACVFESLPVAGDSGDVRSRGVYSDAAAQYCADHAYEVWAAAASSSQQGQARRGADTAEGHPLGACLAALDRRFLNDPAVLPQDRLGSGCTGVLLHIDMAAPAAGPGAEAGARVAAVAAVGPCAAVLGQRQGGFASATAAPLLLAGGSAASHAAVFELLEQLGVERAAELRKAAQLLQQAKAAAGSKKAKKGKGSQVPPPQPVLSALLSAAPQEPRYAPEPEAPAALGFGACKGMGQLVAESGATGPAAGQLPGRSGPQGEALPPPPPPPPRVGLSVQTARHVLQPADESLLLLGAGAAAALSPAEAVLLMHRFGQFAFIPSDRKPEPLEAPPSATAPGAASQRPGLVQADSLGTAGPRPAGAQPSGGSGITALGSAVAPFNAARLVSHQAALAVGRRRAQRSAAAGASAGTPSCCAVLALSLDWPPGGAGRDPASPAGVVAGSPAALAGAAAAALREGRRGLYRWQQLRAYYKLASRRRAALIARWHELFDRVVGAAAAEAKAKEVAAWRRMGAALQVSTAGKVKVIEGQGGQQTQQPAVAAVAAPAAAALAAVAAARGSPMRPAAAPGAPTNSHGASRSPSPPPAAAALIMQQQPAPTPAVASAKAEAPPAAAPPASPVPPAASPPAASGAPAASPEVSPAAIRLEERRPHVEAAAQRRQAAMADYDTATTATPPVKASPAATAAGAATSPAPAAARSSPSPSAASPPAGTAAAPGASPHVTPRGSSSTGGRGIPTPPATTPSRSGGGASAPSPPTALGSMTRTASSRLPTAPGASAGGASSGVSNNPGPQQQRSPPPTAAAATSTTTSCGPSAPRASLAPPALTPPALEGEGEGADLLSPDADQLAMWAAEAAAALEVQQPAQAASKAGGSSLPGTGSMSRAAAAAATAATGTAGAGSRIPLSPSRADNISPRGPAGAKPSCPAGSAPAGGASAAAAR